MTERTTSQELETVATRPVLLAPFECSETVRKRAPPSSQLSCPFRRAKGSLLRGCKSPVLPMGHQSNGQIPQYAQSWAVPAPSKCPNWPDGRALSHPDWKGQNILRGRTERQRIKLWGTDSRRLRTGQHHPPLIGFPLRDGKQMPPGVRHRTDGTSGWKTKPLRASLPQRRHLPHLPHERTGSSGTRFSLGQGLLCYS
jgi:hypothetical protein